MSETRILASYIVENDYNQLPADIVAEAKRAILNYVGCALGGCDEPAVTIALDTLRPFFGSPSAAVIGRPETMDPLHASLMNGLSSHVHDYDDTTPGNYSHPSSPLASALSLRAQEKKLVVVDKLSFEAPKTKRLAGILKVLGVPSAVVVDAKENANLSKSARNLPKSKYLAPEGLNVYDILNHGGLVIAADAIKQVEARVTAPAASKTAKAA